MRTVTTGHHGGQGWGAIEVDQLSKRFGEVRAVSGVSFTIERGSICALLGANGAGKTTTLAMLLGLVTPSTGSIRVLGHDLQRDRFQVLGRMNFSSPYVDLPQRLSVVENLTVVPVNANTPSADHGDAPLQSGVYITNVARCCYMINGRVWPRAEKLSICVGRSKNTKKRL